jgi:ABC-type nickel/cobalt efflux system permease component RcnA
MKTNDAVWAVLAVTAAAMLVHSGHAHAASPFGILTPDSPRGVTWAGPFAPVFIWIARRQAEFYRALTDALDSMKASGGAFWLLAGLSFLYGIFHAAGPGHGKAVISSYMVASSETYRRGVALSFAAAFVQALSAILFVSVAAALLRTTAVQMTAATDWLEIVSYALIAAVGAWLVWSKARGHDHHHHHHHYVSADGAHDDQCGEGHEHRHDDDDDHDHYHDHAHHDHRHDPHSAYGMRREAHEEAIDAQHDAVPLIEPRRSWRRGAAAVAAVGIRPCSGAIILLVFALAQGLFLAGVAATFVMALGTGITVAVLASIAVGARDLAARLGDIGGGRGASVAHAMEVLAALVVLLFGLLMLGGALAARG